MKNAYTGFSLLKTSQAKPIPGREKEQVKNAAGGYVFAVDPWKAFERFLILGTEGGTYYVGQEKLTHEAAINTIKCIGEDGRRAVDLVVAVSDGGRAPKNDPAIFSLALACSVKDGATRAYALAALPKVCRIPTHLFHFITYVRQFRGLGRGLKRALGNWYQEQEVDRLAYEVVKYQQRDGWSNADILRLSHPKTKDDRRNALYSWIVDGYEPFLQDKTAGEKALGDLAAIVHAFEVTKGMTNPKEIAEQVRKHNLSREMIPTEALKSPEVWEALLEKMPLHAMVRNLGNMSKVGLLKPLSEASGKIISALGNRDLIRKSRMHPIQILVALKTYSAGHGMKGSGTWDVVKAVVDALDGAFYLAFDNVEPIGKSLLAAIDVSGSMHTGYASRISQVPNMTAAEGAAAMALGILRTEPNYEIIAFSTKVHSGFTLHKRMSLRDVENEVKKHSGGTDCSAPIKWATDNKIKADGLIILTDNETWAGRYGHPSQAMDEYRKKVNPSAKIVNLAMTATGCTINDPKDQNELSVAGFDASIPAVLAGFMKG